MYSASSPVDPHQSHQRHVSCQSLIQYFKTSIKSQTSRLLWLTLSRVFLYSHTSADVMNSTVAHAKVQGLLRYFALHYTLSSLWPRLPPVSGLSSYSMVQPVEAQHIQLHANFLWQPIKLVFIPYGVGGKREHSCFLLKPKFIKTLQTNVGKAFWCSRRRPCSQPLLKHQRKWTLIPE